MYAKKLVGRMLRSKHYVTKTVFVFFRQVSVELELFRGLVCRFVFVCGKVVTKGFGLQPSRGSGCDVGFCIQLLF